MALKHREPVARKDKQDLREGRTEVRKEICVEVHPYKQRTLSHSLSPGKIK